jgi:signal peptidase I
MTGGDPPDGRGPAGLPVPPDGEGRPPDGEGRPPEGAGPALGAGPVEPPIPSLSDPTIPFADPWPEERGAEVPEPPPPPRTARRRYVREYLETVLVAVLVVLFTATFVTQNSVIPTASMEDTLLVGDYLLVNRIAFAPVDAGAPCAWAAQEEIGRGDVIVFKFPRDPSTNYVKRVIGLPGEVVEIRDKRVRVDGSWLMEIYKEHKTGLIHPRGSADGGRDNFGPVTVPEGSYLVLGDNRDYSADSREWGFVPRENVTGRAFVVFWSRQQAPGAWQVTGAGRLRRFVTGIGRFYSETRWDRIPTLVK